MINLPQNKIMAVLPIRKYFSLNGDLTLCSEFIAAENEGGVYEVIRVIKGIPIFLEEHLSRFYQSAEIAGNSIPYPSDRIKNILTELISANETEEGNILLSCKTNLKAFFIQHVYPREIEFREGVRCGLLHAERQNPNAKVFQTEVRNMANMMISQQGFYEVLLVDEQEQITEGSRSNVFFIREDELLTPPASKVLVGVTRQKTIECASMLGLKFKEMEINVLDLPTYDALFITGTSPNILPVSKIGELGFDVNNHILRKLMQQFDLMITDYLAQKS